MILKLFLVSAFCLFIFCVNAQDDTIRVRTLDDVIIKSYKQPVIAKNLPDVHGTYIIGGRKSEVIETQEISANIAEKTGRQIFARIPGAFIYDMDGSGNQVNFATRGLDPHRSWEYNVRQNGIMINSDIYGYPASHYSPPMEAIKNIEIVRGTASLQYGAEFGGMINYVLKSPDTTRKIGFESINSIGSFGLLSSYNAVGGKIGRLTYYSYYHRRVSDGYRTNANSDAQGQFVGLQYNFSEKLILKAETGRSQYLYHIPGPLTDSMFYNNPRQSTRSRNYYSPDIYVPSFVLQWVPNINTQIEAKLSGVFGYRNSVEFEGFANRNDVIDTLTNQYKHRVVNRDKFNSKTAELRLIHHYQLRNIKNVLSASTSYFHNNMQRRQQGKGTTGSDYDLTIEGNWGRDLEYATRSIAFTIENLTYITPHFSVSPGFRYEHGKTDMTGTISYLDPAQIPNRITHDIPLFGINAQVKFNNSNRIYGGISQAYRPVLFKDIIPASTLERANKDLKDAFGYNAELGINGTLSDFMKFDITLFRIVYKNKLGNLLLTEAGSSYIYKTNIGDSETNGIEFFAEIMALQTRSTYISLFTSTSLMQAKYRNAFIAVGNENKDISGNEVESVPRIISRNGLNLGYKTIRFSFLYSFVSETFSDPTNVEIPTANGAKGIVPAYGIFDLNCSIRLTDYVFVRAGVNNILNKQYFTKRPLFYPGPGVWSSDGRSMMVSIGIRI